MTFLIRKFTMDRLAFPHLVFVYGTLKKNEPNHHWLSSPENGKQVFVTEAKTQKRYPLVIASRYNIPYLLDQPDTGERIHGEVYNVDDDMLARLDVLEDHPKYYVRRKEPVQFEGKEECTECWAYFLPKFKSEMLKLPFLESYSSTGAHGKEYVAREKRTAKDYYSDIKSSEPAE